MSRHTEVVRPAPSRPRRAGRGQFQVGVDLIIATLIRRTQSGSQIGAQGRAGSSRRVFALPCRAQCPDESLSPISPTTISAALATRASVSASPIMTMPNRKAPTAPMPVHTA